MSDTSVLERTEITIELDHNWKVLFHNDDKTPMEFVVGVLIGIFDKTPEQAVPIMLEVHNNGSAVVATYSCFDIADQKANETMTLARECGFPLQVTVEK